MRREVTKWLTKSKVYFGDARRMGRVSRETEGRQVTKRKLAKTLSIRSLNLIPAQSRNGGRQDITMVLPRSQTGTKQKEHRLGKQRRAMGLPGGPPQSLKTLSVS